MTIPEALRPKPPATEAPKAHDVRPHTMWQLPPDVAVHELKTWPGYFQQVWLGRKTFEIRYDDRGYQRGDRIVLREWDPHWSCNCEKTHDHAHGCDRYTGRVIRAEVGYVCGFTPSRGQQRGFNGNGYVVLALCHPTNEEHTREDRHE